MLRFLCYIFLIFSFCFAGQFGSARGDANSRYLKSTSELDPLQIITEPSRRQHDLRGSVIWIINDNSYSCDSTRTKIIFFFNGFLLQYTRIQASVYPTSSPLAKLMGSSKCVDKKRNYTTGKFSIQQASSCSIAQQLYSAS
jgi:hypothetical protein